MWPLRRTIGFGLLAVLLLSSCGGEPPDAPADSAQEPLSDVPEAQAAFEEANELWGDDNRASLAKLEEAIELDPDFLEAHATLSYRYAWIHQNWNRTDSIAQKALHHAEYAMELDPEAVAALSAMGAYYYRILKDYPRAMEVYDQGVELHPENQHFLRMSAHVARREGDWERALQILNRAEEIRPSLDAIQAIAENHEYSRRWDEAVSAYQEHARRAPESTLGPSSIAWIAAYQHGDLEPVREFLDSRPSGWSLPKWNLAMLSRDYEAALAVMDQSTTEVFNWQQGLGPMAMYRGIALAQLGREAEAQTAMEEARQVMESWLPASENDPRVHGALAHIYASLGMRDEALRSAEHALELMPPEKDALLGPFNVMTVARIHAILGEAGPAVEQLEQLFSMPGPGSRPMLSLDPVWDNVRDAPAFQAFLEG
jgi:tetratricopeptide (TPR) repeat protein